MQFKRKMPALVDVTDFVFVYCLLLAVKTSIYAIIFAHVSFFKTPMSSNCSLSFHVLGLFVCLALLCPRFDCTSKSPLDFTLDFVVLHSHIKVFI